MIFNDAGNIAVNPAHVIQVDLHAPHPDPDSAPYRAHWSDDEFDRQTSWRVVVTTTAAAGVVKNATVELHRTKDGPQAEAFYRNVIDSIAAATHDDDV